MTGAEVHKASADRESANGSARDQIGSLRHTARQRLRRRAGFDPKEPTIFLDRQVICPRPQCQSREQSYQHAGSIVVRRDAERVEQVPAGCPSSEFV